MSQLSRVEMESYALKLEDWKGLRGLPTAGGRFRILLPNPAPETSATAFGED